MAQLTPIEKRVARVSVVGAGFSILTIIIGAALLGTGAGSVAGVLLLTVGIAGAVSSFHHLPLSHCTPETEADDRENSPETEENHDQECVNHTDSSKDIFVGLSRSQTEKKNPSEIPALSPSQPLIPQLSIGATITHSIFNFFNDIFSPDVPEENKKKLQQLSKQNSLS